MKKLIFTYSYRIKPIDEKKFIKNSKFCAFFVNGNYEGYISGPYELSTCYPNRWFANYSAVWPTTSREESYSRWENNLDSAWFNHRWQAKRWLEKMTKNCRLETKLMKESGKEYYGGRD